MLGKKVFAAMLATVLGASLFGANAAKAVIDLDLNEGAVTYAMETLEATVTGHEDYYVVTSTDAVLDVRGKVGLAGPSGSFVTIRFDLRGMVFNLAPSLGMIAGHDGTPSRRQGGAGEDFVSFIVPRSSSGNDAETNIVTLDVDGFGVKPGVNGSVTMTVTDDLGDDAMWTAKYDGAVRTAQALMENAMPLDLEATVEHRFMSFNGNPEGTLGSFMVGLETGLRRAAGSAVIDDLMEIIAIGNTSSVTISGDFSFSEMAWLAATKLCPAGTDDLLTRDDDETVMGELKAQDPSVFTGVNATPYLCISVFDAEGDDAVAIPETDPYIVATKYAAGSMVGAAAFGPSGGEHALGKITRDGTTVHIPYLTTFADYNQRIVVSNRGANPADYWITFRPEDGVMATPGMYATGTLAAKSTKVLRAMDVVTLEGRSRTAVTFVAEAQASQIDVATVIVNMMTGGTDTVNYDTDE